MQIVLKYVWIQKCYGEWLYRTLYKIMYIKKKKFPDSLGKKNVCVLGICIYSEFCIHGWSAHNQGTYP